jgi:hypothetical protein
MAQLGPKRVWDINSKKCVKVVGNKSIYNSYAQHGMKGIKIVARSFVTMPTSSDSVNPLLYSLRL